jgi:hypothetical protein
VIEVNVVGDVKEMQRDLHRIKARIPSLTAQAVNSLATWARRQTIEKTARDLGMTKARISTITVRDKAGNKKYSPRFVLTRASPFIPVAYLNVKGKAIEVTDVAHSWNKQPGGGVTALGNTYPGAFKAKLNSKWRVLKRQGAKRLPLKSPYIGTRKSMEETFNRYIAGAAGRAYFRSEFKRLGDAALLKAGIR